MHSKVQIYISVRPDPPVVVILIELVHAQALSDLIIRRYVIVDYQATIVATFYSVLGRRVWICEFSV